MEGRAGMQLLLGNKDSRIPNAAHSCLADAASRARRKLMATGGQLILIDLKSTSQNSQLKFLN